MKKLQKRLREGPREDGIRFIKMFKKYTLCRFDPGAGNLGL